MACSAFVRLLLFYSMGACHRVNIIFAAVTQKQKKKERKKECPHSNKERIKILNLQYHGN